MRGMCQSSSANAAGSNFYEGVSGDKRDQLQSKEMLASLGP